MAAAHCCWHAHLHPHTHTHPQTLTTVITTPTPPCLPACPQDLADKLLSAPVVTGSARFSRTKRSTSAFTLSHYAGPVSYSLDNFLDKNRDYVVEQHATLLAGAQLDLLAELFAVAAPAPADSTQNGRTVSRGAAPVDSLRLCICVAHLVAQAVLALVGSSVAASLAALLGCSSRWLVAVEHPA